MKPEQIDWNDTKFNDPMEEIYAIRQQISAQYGHDIDRYMEAMRERHRDDEARGVKYVRLPIVRWGKAQPSAGGTGFALE